jgi:hypothetical protein
METLRNWGIEIIRMGYIERISADNTEFPSSICLYTVVLV